MVKINTCRIHTSILTIQADLKCQSVKMSILDMIPFLTYPLVPGMLSVSTIAVVLGFSSASSPLRFLGLIPMIIYAIIANGGEDGGVNALQISIAIRSTTGMLMKYLDSALLSRCSYEAQGPTSAVGGQKPLPSPTDDPRRFKSST